MDPDFWHERWQQKQTGFHQTRVNPLLETFWPRCMGAARPRVFVPLCGKSLDMIWLQNLGHPVLGTELSPLAVDEFFRENGLSAVKTPLGSGFVRAESGDISLLCGNHFDLTPDLVGKIGAIYDRAALVAMPPEMQGRYAEQVFRLLPETPPMLLITLEYGAEEMSGPPFPVPEETVVRLFGQAYRIELLSARDALEGNPQLRAKGLSRLTEKAFWLRPKLRPEP
ncbi:thiopurine S-methyltransferase [Methylococcus geothermalis]|uniref:Thiopurine S-methyltransferase n=1 Tax=Methylococcus geothermalis TaxID=2681310 RepID=A0A858Q678_9GAMM|nr:thiopurine S-methyltransferase [Methylococcus geothermalis]QJD29305.1 thiopurine S-methyltransferase [Methylococcus geothermalis]